MKNRKKRRRESGQAMVEFALVLPLFLLLVMGILDFGWLFYNYIGIENSARNAARIACVEYTDTCYDTTQKRPISTKNFDPKVVENNTDEDAYTDEERHIVSTVANSIPDSVNIESIKITYTYDDRIQQNNAWNDYNVVDRSEGDVQVTVKGKIHVLTPVLGVFSDHMQKNLTATSTYKVETRPASDGDD